jgi:PQQ-like domain
LAFHQFVGTIAADGPFTATVNGTYGSGTPVLTALAFRGTWLLGFSTAGVSGPVSITGGRAFMVTGGAVSGFDGGVPCTPIPPPFPSGYCQATWTRAIPGPQPVSYAGPGRIAVASSDGTISVLDGATGAVQFTTASAGVALSPTAMSARGYLFATGTDGVLRAYDTNTCGSVPCGPVWTGAVGAASTVAPAVSGGNVYVATNDGRVVVFAAAGCNGATCAPAAIGDSGTGLAAGAKPNVTRGRVLVPFGKQLVAFGTTSA